MFFKKRVDYTGVVVGVIVYLNSLVTILKDYKNIRKNDA